MSATESLSVSVTDGTANTNSTEHQWETDVTVIVPAESELQATLVVDTDAYTINWSGVVSMAGSAAIFREHDPGDSGRGLPQPVVHSIADVLSSVQQTR